ncbi:MAG: serine hydrolase [Planctomycetes bacterium]|nr:serine hydrolase [Planctomycetota bacterium]
MRFWLTCVLWTFVLATFLSLASNSYGLDLHSEIDPLVQPLIDEGELVGCVVGIVKDGETQVFGYGETKKGDGKRPDGETVYEIGSASKAFTGVLLADLVNAGEVKLDDLVQKYLPESVKIVVHEKPITLERLATHTSGLPRLPNNLFPKDASNPYAVYTVKQLYEYLKGYKLAKSPGEYEYSNLGMGTLGHVLAKQQRMSYERLVGERIAKPLKMKDTRIKLTANQRRRLAPPYDDDLEASANWDVPTLAGAGAIRSTCADMVKFVAAGLAKDDRPITKAMQTAFERRHTMKDGMGIGLGWHIARDGVTRWHNGRTGGYSSWVSVVPSMNAGVVVLSNTSTDKVDPLGEQLTRVACGVNVEAPKKRTEMKVDPKVLEAYAGVFAITPQFALTVTVEDGKLMVQATGQSKLALFPESKTKFFLRAVDAQITFVPDKNGKVNELILHQNGIDQTAKRTD